MKALNQRLRPVGIPDRPHCREMLITEGGWLAPCILRPQHSNADGPTEHLASPYLEAAK